MLTESSACVPQDTFLFCIVQIPKEKNLRAANTHQQLSDSRVFNYYTK